jgi:dihydroorotase
VERLEYDLLLKGGTVIDPRNGVNGVRDVAIAGRKIAAVEAGIAARRSIETVDVTGLYVTPGLVDIHAHVYAGTGLRGAYRGDYSLYPDGHTFRSGVTTVVDAGSSGWRDFEDFKDRVIDRARTRVLAMLNIAGHGMDGQREQDAREMDAEAAARQALRHKDLVVGIKTAHYAGPDWVAVDRAVEAATLAGLPVMTDFGDFRPERPYRELVLERLRPGDISTHMYLRMMPLLDGAGRVFLYLFDARKRGVFFDVGYGGGSFLFRQAVPAIRQGWIPDSISTDLHALSMNGGMQDMMNVMSNFLNMGMTLEAAIAATTWNPAREIRREDLGNLSAGAPADAAVLRLAEGECGFVDTFGARMKGTRRLVCELTVRDGRVVWDRNGKTRQEWDELAPDYGIQGDARWDGMLRHPEQER